MLILTRRPGESLLLGDEIKITVLGVHGKQIKIGLDVPQSVAVYREEVYLRVLEQNKQASSQNAEALKDIGRSACQGSRVVNTRFGEATVHPEAVIRFPRGLIGFEHQHEFALLNLKEDSPFMLLQSLDMPALGFLVTDPFCFVADYDVVVPEADKNLLEVQSVGQVAVLVTVTIPAGCPDATTLNLAGPIVLNHEARIGLQVPQMDSRFPAHFRPTDLLPQADNGAGNESED